MNGLLNTTSFYLSTMLSIYFFSTLFFLPTPAHAFDDYNGISADIAEQISKIDADADSYLQQSNRLELPTIRSKVNNDTTAEPGFHYRKENTSPATGVTAKKIIVAKDRAGEIKPSIQLSTANNSVKKKGKSENLETKQPSSDEALVRQRLLAWARAWSKGNTRVYLSFYQPDFHPDGLSHATWLANRKQKVIAEKKIKVRLSDIQISFSPDKHTATTQFLQDYTSFQYHDTVLKKIVWKKSGDSWLIQSEKVVKKL